MGLDPFDLERFVLAQAPVYDVALTELIGGRKVTHWMWFVFPQHGALGRSSMARRYGIGTRAEARAYLAHPILGHRFRDCVTILLDGGETDPTRVFGSPDDRKFVSSMTLFYLASESPDNLFGDALARFNHGRLDQASVKLLDA